jgi:hypothetical protein
MTTALGKWNFFFNGSFFINRDQWYRTSMKVTLGHLILGCINCPCKRRAMLEIQFRGRSLAQYVQKEGGGGEIAGWTQPSTGFLVSPLCCINAIVTAILPL